MKVVHVSGKRKRAIARATISPGNGRIRVNNRLLESITKNLARDKLMETIILSGNIINSVDINIKVKGGGAMGQAEAARLAMARGLVEFYNDKKLEKKFLDYDRQMLVADVRRKESSKPNRHGQARAKRQKSYR